MEILTTSQLNVRIGGVAICTDLNLAVTAGERWCLLGRNGVGKTTLLHTLIGLHGADAGSVYIEGESLENLTRRDIARKAGILFQEGLDTMPATVLETALLGRHPHSQSLLLDDEKDLEIAREALHTMGLDLLCDRQLSSLSGGERQRLALAKLLVQQPRLYLLDEPSNHLDIGFQVRLQQVLQQRLQRDSAALVMATHDINLAARFCNRFLLLNGDGSAKMGNKQEVLNRENLSTAFDCPMETASHDGQDFFYPGGEI